MFDLANNRLSYSELLRPDAGFTLEFAAGMTYSLDLEALIGVPVSLGLLDQADPESLRSPLYILEAIRRSSDYIALFCNAGNIQLPRKIEPVYSLLENSVFPVQLPKYRNFHPKIWVLKYSQEGKDPYIKLLVMSRNLTFDSSIDISVAMQGKIGTEENPKHKPLADLLRFISNYAGKKKQDILSLSEDVLKATRFEVSHPFKDYDFFPMGIPEYSGINSPLFSRKSDLFCVSPFLSDDIQSHYDPDDGERFNRIRQGIEAKQNAEIRRNLFTGYMTQTESETREMLRKAYLSEAGIEEDENDDF